MARWFKKNKHGEDAPSDDELPQSKWDGTDVPWDDTDIDPAETNLAPTPPPPTRGSSAEPEPERPAPSSEPARSAPAPEPPPASVSQPVPAPPPVISQPASPPPAVSQPVAFNPRELDTSDRTLIGGEPDEVVGMLVVKEGQARGELYPVLRGDNVVGRGKTARIRLDERDVTVSREHARIAHHEDGFTIHALREEQNPTYVNEVKVVGGSELRDGDSIRLGHTVLKFRVA